MLLPCPTIGGKKKSGSVRRRGIELNFSLAREACLLVIHEVRDPSQPCGVDHTHAGTEVITDLLR